MTRHPLRSLVVLPDDSAAPLLEAIRGARASVRLKIFALADRLAVDALIAARRRGLDVRVMVDPARVMKDEKRVAARQRLIKEGVEVRDGNPAFSVTHEKSLVIDDATSFVQSCNWESENFTHTRDYAVCTTDRDEVAEVAECFDADWSRELFQPGEPSSLIWCPWEGRERIAHFIDRAKSSLIVENERFQDPIIVERVVRARTRGVKVHILTRPVHSLSEENLAEGVAGLQVMHDVGAKIHRLEHLKLHAKMMLADDARAIVGSINISVGSFDKRRELSIEVTDHAILDRLRGVYHQDWKRSKPLDLSDKGLAADLERHQAGPEVVEQWRSLAEE
jgi:phosphatidylserine/phosphatidylglycerophosphate/cardiolipin synthase-like enzyme